MRSALDRETAMVSKSDLWNDYTKNNDQRLRYRRCGVSQALSEATWENDPDMLGTMIVAASLSDLKKTSTRSITPASS
jgi:hypothetical protein